MTCPKCGSRSCHVKASRGPHIAKTHIPAAVLSDIEENIGFVTQHWYARHRVCQCGHIWWTVEAAVVDINELASPRGYP